MNSALYIGATGMKALAEGMNVVSNNIANSSTVGFKQQSMQFSDLMYSQQAGMGGWWNAQEDSRVALGQMGHGVQVDSVRTLFTEGGYESSNTFTDMSIGGKGFFEVTNIEGKKLYTRAGNFRFDEQGFLKLPSGEVLTGYRANEDGSLGPAGPIQVDLFAKSAPKATTGVQLGVNIGFTEDKSTSTTDPYFGLLEGWIGSNTPPLSSSQYGYSQAMTVYDASGVSHDVTAYFDMAPAKGSQKVVEFVIGANPNDPNALDGDGLLMSGTLTFDSKGQLVDMTAFTPGSGDKKDLNNWTMAPLVDGLPQFTLNGQAITLDLGVKSGSDWDNVPTSAAAIGTDPTLLPTIRPLEPSARASTAYAGSSSTSVRDQDGFGEGTLSNMSINKKGQIVADYSNGRTSVLYEIPICRFTSEDGLRREGGNMFSPTADSGQMQMGRAGTENYGPVISNSLELSNVDMAREMVNMIVTQRGFQSNSKAVTTADAMLQKAMELKR